MIDSSTIICLNKITERQWLDGGDRFSISWRLEEVSCFGQLGCSLQVLLISRLGSFGLDGLVFLLAPQDFLLTLGVSYVLDTDMDTLLNDSSVDELVDTDSHSRLGQPYSIQGTDRSNWTSGGEDATDTSRVLESCCLG